MYNRRQFIKTAATVAASTFLAGCNHAEEVTAAPAAPPPPPAPSGPKPKRLVFVHGRAQEGKDPTALKKEWLDTLRTGATAGSLALPDGLDVAFPFYGDRLYELARQSEVPLTSDIHTRGGALQDQFLAFQAEFADEVRQQAGITDAQVQAEFDGSPQERGPLNWKWVQALLRAIDRNGGGLGEQALESFTRDVFIYTRLAGVRDEIDSIVREAFTEEPTVIVSHSLGTVVTYNILRNDPRQLKVPLLVTVGSPLGVRAVRDQLRPIRYPRGVGAWYNAFDPTDVVALYPLDASNFPVTPAVENNSKVKNHTDNHHGIVGYLDDKAVAKKIVGALA